MWVTPEAVAAWHPPRRTGKPGAQADAGPTRRDRHIQTIARRGRVGRQRATGGHGRRSAMACAVIDRMTSLGMPISSRVF